MTFLDSSAIIDFLADDDQVRRYLADRKPFFTSTICVFEVINGKLGSGTTDVRSIRDDFGGVRSIAPSEEIVLEAARLQDELLSEGVRLSQRDVLIAATARSTGDEFVVADSDFETSVLEDKTKVTNLRT